MTDRLRVETPEASRIWPQPLRATSFMSFTRLCPLTEHVMSSVAGREYMVPPIASCSTEETYPSHTLEILPIARELGNLLLPCSLDYDLARAIEVRCAVLLRLFGKADGIVVTAVFPGLSDGHGPKVDVWYLGVVALEWIYGLPTLPASPQPRRKQKTITTSQWYDWVADWTTRLLEQLKDEDEGHLIEILFHMIEVNARKRWPTNKCLALGFENGLFKRRRADGLVVCMYDSYDPIVPGEEGNEGTQTPTAALPSVRASPPQSLTSIDPDATIILGNMRDDEGLSTSR